MPQSNPKNDRSIFQRTGLSPFVFGLKFYGFIIDMNSESRKWSDVLSVPRVVFTAVLCVLGMPVIIPFIYFNTQGLSDVGAQDRYDSGALCNIILITISSTAVTFHFLFACLSAKHLRTFMWSVATAVERLSIHKNRKRCLVILKIFSVVTYIATVFGSIMLIAIFICWAETGILVNNPTFQFGNYFVRFFEIVVSVWCAVLVSFYIFVSCLFLCFTVVVNRLIAFYTPRQKYQTTEVSLWDNVKETIDVSHIVERCKGHRNLSVLVNCMDEVFNKFLLISLSLEMSISVLAIQVMRIQSSAFFINGVLQFHQLIFLIWKALAAANINDKLKSSLTLKDAPNSFQDLKYCSAEHVNYILYMNEQSINKAELSYGGFFPVRKTFIFTIAGTALTYALVLNGVGS